MTKETISDAMVEAARNAFKRRGWGYRDEDIRAAITAALAAEPGEPVAWQYRFNVAGKWGGWQQLEGPPKRFRNQYSFNLSNGTAELRPLYAHPHHQPLPLKEEVERVLEQVVSALDGRVHSSPALSAIHEAAALLSRIREGAAPEPISLSDPSVILAGIKQFGLAPDGSDLRDLERAIEAQAAELSSLRAKLAEAMEVVRPFNMQEVRLAVGEGKLRPIDVLNGVNAELKHRARRLIEENGK